MSNKLSFLTENYKSYLAGKSLIMMSVVGFCLFMSIYILSDDESAIYKRGQIKLNNLNQTFSDNDNSIKIALEERIKNLEKKVDEKNNVIEDIITGKTSIPSLDNFKEELKKLKNKKQDPSNKEKIKPKNIEISESNEPKENVIYKYQNKTFLGEKKSDQLPKNNFYQNIDSQNSSSNNSQDYNDKRQDSITNNEIEMVVFGNDSDFDVNEYLPAGSIATAKLLSSVDAAVGVTSQSEPRPVLLRITSFAYSSSHKEDLNLKNKTDVRGCTLTGEASGDLSSERGYIKLIKMTCSSDDEKITEADVYGYVSSYGKAGIRGRVIEKEGDLVLKSFMSGILANLGKAVEQRYQPSTSISGAVASVQRSSSDIAKSGVGSGFGSSLDRLSDYYIKKMEQIEPVISIGQGLEVEVIFYKGSFVDGRKSKKNPLKKL